MTIAMILIITIIIIIIIIIIDNNGIHKLRVKQGKQTKHHEAYAAKRETEEEAERRQHNTT